MDILIRSIAIFAFLWFVVRVGGKREVAQLSAFDMILLITVGDLVSQGIVQEDYSVTAAVIAVTTSRWPASCSTTSPSASPGSGRGWQGEHVSSCATVSPCCRRWQASG